MVTHGRMETLPIGSSYSKNGEAAPLPDHIVCPSAKMTVHGIGKIEISANGVDYDGTGFPFEFQEPADLFRIAPQSGPKETGGKIKIVGGGLTSTSQLYTKIGNYKLEPINREKVSQMVWSLDEYLDSQLMTRQDLRQFKAVQHKLEEKQKVQSQLIRTVGAPAPS